MARCARAVILSKNGRLLYRNKKDAFIYHNPAVNNRRFSEDAIIVLRFGNVTYFNLKSPSNSNTVNLLNEDDQYSADAQKSIRTSHLFMDKSKSQ